MSMQQDFDLVFGMNMLNEKRSDLSPTLGTPKNFEFTTESDSTLLPENLDLGNADDISHESENFYQGYVTNCNEMILDDFLNLDHSQAAAANAYASSVPALSRHASEVLKPAETKVGKVTKNSRVKPPHSLQRRASIANYSIMNPAYYESEFDYIDLNLNLQALLESFPDIRDNQNNTTNGKVFKDALGDLEESKLISIPTIGTEQNSASSENNLDSDGLPESLISAATSPMSTFIQDSDPLSTDFVTAYQKPLKTLNTEKVKDLMLSLPDYPPALSSVLSSTVCQSPIAYCATGSTSDSTTNSTPVQQSNKLNVTTVDGKVKVEGGGASLSCLTPVSSSASYTSLMSLGASKKSTYIAPKVVRANSIPNLKPSEVLNNGNSIPKTRGRKPSLVDDPSKQFGCKYCPRKFKRQEHLKRHILSLHVGEKRFGCPICGKNFSRSDNLNQHIKTHSNENSCQKKVTKRRTSKSTTN
ncbi:C2H2-type zinc finger protein KNAG_0G01280 [Huiozyma naganishii CBS 8797]|uniref:C2H2-type domain-containing protein n=1 Tax=Huiozyma naganishii (strain ATCC MYA-139 / BCRC 22969 / CBS 8797 / KCTC 17520 / NBRC 10181 / NCYC 3082 / Yp74L-3) TaxID=1071383 RepID=J7S8Y8_HUIN7|nr:hypothetical protein KNAG_0G01280 [Kazachstania naganishii CBS 8797]CCK71186.1 hypothetical protein KNAG_0G01280 [Kazachstania naganishii CBS 8797]